MSIEEFIKDNTEYTDGSLRLRTTSLDIEPDITYMRPSTNISCKVIFNIYRDPFTYIIGRVFLESIDYKKYINVWINIHDECDSNIFTKILIIIENNVTTNTIYIPTSIEQESIHQILDGIGYIHIKDYIYPDIKLYCKEMK